MPIRLGRVTLPLVGSSSPVKIFIRVDLPAPFGPVIAYRRPVVKVVVTSSNRTRAPYRIDTLFTESIALHCTMKSQISRAQLRAFPAKNKSGRAVCTARFLSTLVFSLGFVTHEHPLKSVRATFVTVAGVTTSGIALASVIVMISEGEQSTVPPLFSTAARASTVKGTDAAAGAE